MPVDVLLGLQWGDEGKGKIVDFLSGTYDLIARFQGGPNAGHTIVFGREKFVLHTIPSGIFRENTMNLIGNGVVIDPITLNKEVATLVDYGVDVSKRLQIARKAHLILPTHRMLDAASELAKGKEKIGSTLRGIGPTYMDKTGRNGLRIGDIEKSDFKSRYNRLKDKHLGLLKLYPKVDIDLELEETKWFAAVEELKKLSFVDCEFVVNEYIKSNKRILAEGAQGSMLDIEYGTYPFVTSSNTITAGVCTGLGIAPQHIGEVIGITKAYCTRVGSGPFPTELFDETGEELQKQGAEFGATTGRPRRCGWLDLVQLKYVVMINGVTQIAITKADVMNGFETIRAATNYQINGKKTTQYPYEFDGEVVVDYEDIEGWQTSLDGILSYDKLPSQIKDFCNYLENELGTRISLISTGPERSKLIVR